MMMTPEIAWTDVETTGLDTRKGHKLLQIACIITNGNFDELHVLEQKFYYSPEEVLELKAIARRDAGDYVVDMHEKTGLWDALSDPANPRVEDFDLQLLRWLKEIQPASRSLVFGGNSITLDREFIREFLPLSYDHISYRNLDMTSVEKFFHFTEGRPYFQKKLAHDALDDIRESIASAKYQRDQNKPF